MAHERLSPRQKMIGMMYLVLTAMLALNVSKEALDAFKNIEKGLSLTIKNYSLKNNLIYQDFDASYAQNKEKTGPYRAKALEVKQRADELFLYLQGLKIEIIKTAEGEDTPAVEGDEVIIDEVKKRIDDNNVPSQILIGANDDQKAFFLTTMIEVYRDYLINDILQGGNPTVEEALKKSLNTDNVRNEKTKEMEKWANHNFQALPLVYVITMLSKIQVDVRNAETEVITHLFAQIDKASFKFNKIDAVVIPKATYITLGSNYEASVFVSATDSTQDPRITVGNQTLPLDETGKGVYSVKPTKTGPVTWGGIISLQAPDGTTKTYDFSENYFVGEPNIVVSPTAMNVMYAGIPNPIDVSVPGTSPEKISIKVLNNGAFTTEKVKNSKTGENFSGNYAVKPTNAGQNIQIQVLSVEDGKTINHGIKEFRVKSVPKPEARFANRSSGKLPIAEARIQPGLFAVLPDFDFDLVYNITNFTLVYTDKMGDQKETSTGSALTSDQKGILARVTRGKMINFTEIKAKGPDGKIVDLNALVFEIE